MDVEKKLAKRRGELQELKSICEDFADKLADMKDHLLTDIGKIQERTILQTKLESESATGTLMDENGNPVNIMEELTSVESELKRILEEVS